MQQDIYGRQCFLQVSPHSIYMNVYSLTFYVLGIVEI